MGNKANKPKDKEKDSNETSTTNNSSNDNPKEKDKDKIANDSKKENCFNCPTPNFLCCKERKNDQTFLQFSCNKLTDVSIENYNSLFALHSS